MNVREIPRLLPPVGLAILGIAIAALMLVLVPAQGDMEQRIAAQKPDQLSLTYLQLAVHEAPNDMRLRLLLARQYHEMSRYDDADRVLAPLVASDTPHGMRARLLAIEVQHARCTGSIKNADDQQHSSSRCAVELIAAIRVLLDGGDELSAADFERLAAISLANRAPNVAGDAYSRLADSSDDRDARAKWRHIAASFYLEGEKPGQSAVMHARTAREQSSPRAENQVAHTVDRLREADRADDALALALAELERFPSSEALLQRTVALALENDRPHLAAELGRRLLGHRSGSAAAVADQLALELAIGELDRALALAQRLVALDPKNPRAREDLAKLADWTGKPLLALDTWMWLTRRRGDRRYSDRAFALAEANWDQERLLELTLRSLGDEPDEQLEVVELYMRLGRPEDARVFLDKYLARNPDFRPGWDKLVAIHGSMADFPAIAFTWQRIHSLFGTTPKEAQAWAEALWRAQRPAQALAVLEDSTGNALGGSGKTSPQWRCETPAGPDSPAAVSANLAADGALLAMRRPASPSSDANAAPDPLSHRPHGDFGSRDLASLQRSCKDDLSEADAESLRMMAELAWQLERLDTARAALMGLWRKGVASGSDVERLIIAANHTGAVDLAIHVAEASWRDNGRPQQMLRAMRIAFEARRWGDLARLENATRRDDKVHALADYWRMRRARRQRSLRMALARGDFDNAHAILVDLNSELKNASRASREFARQADAEKLWQVWYRQQLYVAFQRQDYTTIARVLDTARKALGRTPEYWRLRIALSHRDLTAALERGDNEAASAVLDKIRGELALAQKVGLGQHPDIEALREDADRQTLYLAIARNDLDTAEKLIDKVVIPDIDRFHILQRLGRHRQAIEVATEAQLRGISPDDSGDIESPLENAARRRPRQIAGFARILGFDGATLVQAGPEAEYTWRRVGLRATATASRLDAELAGDSQTASRRAQEAQVRVAGRWLTGSSTTELGVGANLQSQNDAGSMSSASSSGVAQVDFTHVQKVGDKLQITAQGGLGQPTEETAALRYLAVRDHASLALSLDLTTRLFATAEVGRARYRLRQRAMSGAMLESGAGTARDAHLSLGYRLRHSPTQDWSLRLVGRRLSRSCTLPACCGDLLQPCGLVPDETAHLVATAFRFTNGQPGLVATPVRRLRYSLDLVAGWLAPAERLLYSAVAGVGIPVFGSDELAVTAELSTMGTDVIAGDARVGLLVRYAKTLWR